MFQLKVVENYIYKKLGGRTCVSPTGVELEIPKIAKFELL